MNFAEDNNSPVFNALIATAAFVVVVAGVHAARIIVIPFLLAIFIAVILSAILSWLRERNIKTSVAVSLMILILGVMGTLMVLVVGASVNELVRKLPQINTAVKAQEQVLTEWMERHGLSLERGEKNESSAPSYQISVPSLIPAPDKKGPEQPEESKPDGDSTPPAGSDGESPDDSQKEQPEAPTTSDPPEDTSGTPSVPNESSSEESTEQPSGNASVPPTPAEAEQGDERLAAADADVDSMLPVADVGESAPEWPAEDPTLEDQTDLMEPKYIFEPQIIKLAPSTASSQVRQRYGGVLGAYSPVEIFRSFLDSVLGVFNYTLIVFLMLAFLLLEWSRFGQKLERLPGNTQSHISQVTQILDSIRRYMFIKTLVSLLTGLLVTIWLMLLGTNYAILWGTVAFLFNYIPTIGSIIAGIVPTLFVLVDQGPVDAAAVGVAFLVVNFLVGNVLEPRIMGEGLGLSTFVVFLSLVFWGFVLGPVGMLLAVPLTMAIKIALGSDERTRWLAFVLGASASPETAEAEHHHVT